MRNGKYVKYSTSFFYTILCTELVCRFFIFNYNDLVKSVEKCEKHFSIVLLNGTLIISSSFALEFPFVINSKSLTQAHKSTLPLHRSFR